MKRKTSWKKLAGASMGFVASLSFEASLLAQNALIYDNANLPSVKSGQNYAPSEGTEFGNEVSLAPLAGFLFYTLWNFSLEYNTPGTVGNAHINFYANTGALFNGIANSAEPSTLLGTLNTGPLPATTSQGSVFTITPSTTILLPAQFTWTVTFTGGTSTAVGLDTYGPPTIGWAFNDIWQNTGSGWQLLNTVNGVTTATFGAQISGSFGWPPPPIPEPGTFALGLMGFVALGGRVVFKGRNPCIDRPSTTSFTPVWRGLRARIF